MSLRVQLIPDHGKRPIRERASNVGGMAAIIRRARIQVRLDRMMGDISFGGPAGFAGEAGTHPRPPQWQMTRSTRWAFFPRNGSLPVA
jgi:hypothetical protein